MNNAPAVNTSGQHRPGHPGVAGRRSNCRTPRNGPSRSGPSTPSSSLTAGKASLRGDYYRQADSYARIFNTESDELEGYQNVNATLTFTNKDWDLDIQIYGKNLTDEVPITDLYLTDDSSGLFTNTFTTEPRQYGIGITKRF